MVTGRPPFEGDTLAAVFDELLNRRPTWPQSLNPGLPPSLAAVIDKALEKDREQRYRSAHELLQDLKRVEISSARAVPAAGVSAAVKDLAIDRRPALRGYEPAEGSEVLLSRNHRGDHQQPGASSRLARHLADVGLCVPGEGSRDHGDRQKARVGTALEGSVRKAGDRVRITTQLVDAETGHQLWSKGFDRELSDVFAIQDEIAATVVDEFRSGLTGAPVTRRSTFDVEAHDAYCRGCTR